MELNLVELLRAAWIAAATLPVIIAFISSSRLSWVDGVWMGFAGRGKIWKSSSQKFTVPQRFSLHFYAVGSVWTTFLLITTWIYASKMVSLDEDPFSYSTITSYLTGSSSFRDSTKIGQRYVVWRAVFLLLLMELQVLRCLYESIYVFNYSPSARMHAVVYLLGLLYYVAAPLSLCCDCATEVYEFTVNQVIEFIVKGKNQMPLTDLDFAEFLKPLLQLGWQQWIGAAIFQWGWIHQCRCHSILGLLRERPKQQANEYIIPHGDWFEIVSSPHYLAEIVIYGGLVVASGGRNLTIWLLLGVVVANLTLAAVETHRWYLQKFEDYPKNRFAIIPLVL